MCFELGNMLLWIPNKCFYIFHTAFYMIYKALSIDGRVHNETLCCVGLVVVVVQGHSYGELMGQHKIILFVEHVFICHMQ